MSYSDPNQNPLPETYIPSTNDTNSIEAAQKLKLYQAFIFSVPICFTFIILFVFYVIYLRRRSSNVDWSSLGMRGASFVSTNDLSMTEIGLSKELREMLPIVIFRKSFTINDSQCSVCLGDYQADEKLQQIPACGHTFHMDCIDLWLTSHTTCPLCRLSLKPKAFQERSHQSLENVSSMVNSNGEASAQLESQSINAIPTHIDDIQEGDREDSREVFKETQENDQNIVGTSDASCNCRLG
ncbi:unnamed protein product [Microthlaspi erraticum]|uniref:RING-type E3 ubiquitin transferase n=1 Tax=Microthlaspi erraticum TaxID=1685480 RepID=A0A6D2J7I5_9BRAS|nr:unnamed protein product [Microthlaspi erraticum]